MKFGLVLPNFGERSDPRTLADLARLAEAAGWDGVFLPDTIQMVGTEGLDTSDPWIDLAAIALRTHQIRIGLIVSTPARYRPWQLARQAATEAEQIRCNLSAWDDEEADAGSTPPVISPRPELSQPDTAAE